ncbi:unnamed protein product [Moneuplotes crassus]|uniref:Uncharacterized protein n=1 Tax=Euplotes crassus TaxID=5936 RepID=A0AAD1XH09_EUPCR|nr:unnamed protein product [Moneuplotes crassus]
MNRFHRKRQAVIQQIPQGCIIGSLDDLGLSNINHISEISSVSEKQLPWDQNQENISPESQNSNKNLVPEKVSKQIKKISKIRFLPSNTQDKIIASKNRARLSSYNVQTNKITNEFCSKGEKLKDYCTSMKASFNNIKVISPKVQSNQRNKAWNLSRCCNFTKDSDIFQSGEVLTSSLEEMRSLRPIDKVYDLKTSLTKKLRKNKCKLRNPSIANYPKPLKKNRCSRRLKKSVAGFSPAESCHTAIKVSQTLRERSKERSNSSTRAYLVASHPKKFGDQISQIKIKKRTISNVGLCKKKPRHLKPKKKREVFLTIRLKGSETKPRKKKKLNPSKLSSIIN